MTEKTLPTGRTGAVGASTGGGNRQLRAARRARQDEYYTQLTDIEKELRHYKPHFAGKIVYLNCDDPRESNFFKYFAMNFNVLGLKRLIATSYAGSPVAGSQLSFDDIGIANGQRAHKLVIDGVDDFNEDGRVDLADVDWLLRKDANAVVNLEGDGDFRSPECVDLLREADIVVTNPPFSLFREYIAQLVEHGKQFLILGNQNAVTFKEVFPLIRDGKLWLGVNNGGDKWFQVPDDYTNTAAGHSKWVDGIQYHKHRNIYWFTNLDHRKRDRPLPLYRRYTPTDYPSYDNYDAIEVGRVNDIPEDWGGVMGVPITFLDKHNPTQFEILGITDRDNNSGLKTKEYDAADTPDYGEMNRRGAIMVGGKLKSTYARILIRRLS